MQPHAQSPGKIGRWPRVLRGPRAALLLLVVLLVAAELFLGQMRGYGNPRLVSPHAGAGYALVPDQSIRGPHGTREVINGSGFREREWSAAEGARPRVVVLGHSLSYGVGVEVEQAWPRLVEERLRAGGLAEAMVLNLAVPGYGLDQMLAVYDAAGRELEPDAVVLDLAPYSVRPMVRLVEPADFPLSRWIRRSALFDWVRRRRHTGGLESSAAERVVRDPHDPANDALWQAAYERLDALHAELAARGARLVVLATPRLEEILGAGVGETRWRAWCESRAGVRFVSCADALEASMPGLIEELRTRRLDPILPRGRVARLDGEHLKFGGESSFFLDDMQHLTPRGHAIVAELVAGALEGLPGNDERAAPDIR